MQWLFSWKIDAVRAAELIAYERRRVSSRRRLTPPEKWRDSTTGNTSAFAGYRIERKEKIYCV